MDVILDAAEGLVVQPDVLFVSSARQDIVMDRVYGAPDLVAEVLSPHPRIGRLDERVGWFARYGVRECWLIDQEQHAVAVLTLRTNGVARRTLHRGGNLIESTVLPGLPLSPLGVLGW
jgi:Uma2 family endonuclease